MVDTSVQKYCLFNLNQWLIHLYKHIVYTPTSTSLGNHHLVEIPRMILSLFSLVGGLKHFFQINWEWKNHPNWQFFFQRGRVETNHQAMILSSFCGWKPMGSRGPPVPIPGWRMLWPRRRRREKPWRRMLTARLYSSVSKSLSGV